MIKVLSKKMSYRPDDLGFTNQHIGLKLERVDGRFKVSAPSMPQVEPVVASTQAEAIQDFKAELYKFQSNIQQE